MTEKLAGRIYFDFEMVQDHKITLVRGTVLTGAHDRDTWMELFESVLRDAKTGLPAEDHTYFVPPHRIIGIKLEIGK